MVQIVSTFFGIIGADMVPPSSIAELIPYMLNILVGLALVLGVFAVIGGIVKAVFYSTRRF